MNNVTYFKILKEDKFRLPLKSAILYYNIIYSLDKINFHVDDSGTITCQNENFWYGESLCINGELSPRYIIIINGFGYQGKETGKNIKPFIKLLATSKGMIEARMVWDGGEKIQILKVKNGKIKINDVI